MSYSARPTANRPREAAAGLRIFTTDSDLPTAKRSQSYSAATPGGGVSLQGRIPSPLHTFERPTQEPSRSPSGATRRTPLASPTYPVPARFDYTTEPPISPNRVKGSTGKNGDFAFEAVKAAASRDALLDQVHERPREDDRDSRARPDPLRANPPTGDLSSTTSLRKMSAIALATARADPKPLGLRTSSLESTISLTASQSQSLGPPPSESPEAVDIPALIAAAGSPEAAIRKLLQEKHSASSHSAQLWRLVEKQRAMILGLNKDLDRAMKDKERYRKKLKDHLVSSASIMTLPSSATRASLAIDRGDTQSPAVSDPASDVASVSGRNSDSPSDTLTPHSGRPSLSRASSQMATGNSTIFNPMHATPMQAPFGAPPAVRPPTRGDSRPSTPRADGFPEHRLPTGTPPTTYVSDPVEQLNIPQHLSSSSNMPLTVNTGEISPLHMHSPTSFSSPKDRGPQSSRRAPPAPLNLTQDAYPDEPTPTANPPAQASTYGTDRSSSPSFGETEGLSQRGRRKTREHDDDNRGLLDPGIAMRKGSEMSVQSFGSAAATSSPERSMSISSGYSSPDEPGSPHIAQVQTYQSLNALNAVLKTPQDPTFNLTVKQSSTTAPSLLSPGLPISPRPIDRPMNSPLPRAPKGPMNSVGIPMTPRTAGLPLSPREPRRPIAPPLQTPMSLASPHLARAQSYHLHSYNNSMPARTMSNATSVTAYTEGSRSPGDIYRGFMSEQYPGLLLPPNALPSIFVKVDSSRLRPSRYSYMAPKQSEENPVFTLAIYARSDNSQLWKIEKTLDALSTFDQHIKSESGFRTKLPDRTLFTGHAPAKIDARRLALGHYFESLLDTQLDEAAAVIVCTFFSSDAIGSEAQEYFHPSHAPSGSVDIKAATRARPRRDGYLTKKGQRFGGWKARYFVCDGPLLKYFEAPGGAQLGVIKLYNATIGKQTQHTEEMGENEEDQFRHAFLIMEPKKRDAASHVKHVLCAESDEERDLWVQCLLAYVSMSPPKEKSFKPGDSQNSPKSPRGQKSMIDIPRSNSTPLEEVMSKPNSLRAVGYNSTVAAEAPIMMGNPDVRTARPMPPPTPTADRDDTDSRSLSHPSISAPSNGTVIQNAEAWGNKHAPNLLTKERIPVKDREYLEKDRERKRSIFAFRGRSSSDTVGTHLSVDSTPVRPVFGVPLAEVCEFNAPIDVPVQIPAVFYRCIEYLRAKDAAGEEGIFRLSGSNIVIKALRERFNTEGDIKLLAPGEQYYDVHAVAGLLKLYLRELPSSVLTRELHLEFLKALELPEHIKMETANVLVNRLPRPNRELLEQLSAYLKEIVDNEAVNKMSVRNVGIVFAPTLNIPAPLISLFVTDWRKIFGPPMDISTPMGTLQTSSTMPLPSPHAFLPGDGIRSPRKQMFSNLPTPSYSQTSFGNINGMSISQPVSRDMYDTGFAPVVPSYVPQYPPPPPPPPVPAQSSQSVPAMKGIQPSTSGGSIGQYVNLNDVEISSSPLMGGESPEIPRDRGFDQPGRQLRRQSQQFLMNVGLIDKDRPRTNGTPPQNPGGRF